MELYLDIMYSESSGNVSVGHKKISEYSKQDKYKMKHGRTLTQKQCEDIKKRLVDLGVVETHGTSTKIIKKKAIVS